MLKKSKTVNFCDYDLTLPPMLHPLQGPQGQGVGTASPPHLLHLPMLHPLVILLLMNQTFT